MKKVLQLRCSGALLGAENVVLELASHISQKFGYQSIIGVIHDIRDPYPELATQANHRNIPCRVFETSKKIDMECIRSIKQFINSEKIDIVHSHGYREDIYVFLTFTKATRVATNHLWKKSNRILKLYAFIDSLCMTRFQHIIAVSKPILSEMQAIYYLGNNKLSLIANGIDVVKFSPANQSTIRHELDIADNTILMSTISSLTIEKGHTYLLTALAQLKNKITNFHLIIIGDGPERQKLEHQIASSGLEGFVTMLGKRSDIDKLHTGTDVYILPSLKEGLPMSLLEAMACGTASIASDVGDVSSCLLNNETGLLIKSKDPQDLHDAMLKLIENDALRSQLGTAGARLIREQFSNETMIKHHAKLYESVTN